MLQLIRFGGYSLADGDQLFTPHSRILALCMELTTEHFPLTELITVVLFAPQCCYSEPLIFKNTLDAFPMLLVCS